MSLKYLFNSGKNAKWLYYLRNLVRDMMSLYFLKGQYARKMNDFINEYDMNYVMQRVNYYNKLEEQIELPKDAKKLKELKKYYKAHGGSVYYFDSKEIIRYFNQEFYWDFCFGDVIHVPDCPAVVKSRPLTENNQNSIILNMDKVRHFVFLNDKKPFREKQNKVIFRGTVECKKQRIDFMERYADHPLFDAGDVSNPPRKESWKKKKITLWEHLDYKFIMSLEGNDVASNLKWVMSSNSLAVMPKPTCETWFMEGRLKPNYHYVEVASDFSDLEDKIDYYIKNPEKAEEIIKNANEYIEQFKDKRRERFIGLLVMQKYFERTNQTKKNEFVSYK